MNLKAGFLTVIMTFLSIICLCQDYSQRYHEENIELRKIGITLFEKKEFFKAYEQFSKIIHNLNLTPDSPPPISGYLPEHLFDEVKIFKKDELNKVYYYIGKCCMQLSRSAADKNEQRKWELRALAAFEQQVKRNVLFYCDNYEGDIQPFGNNCTGYYEILEFCFKTCEYDKEVFSILAPNLYKAFAPFFIYRGKEYEVIILPGCRAVDWRSVDINFITYKELNNRNEKSKKRKWFNYKFRFSDLDPTHVKIHEADDLILIEMIWASRWIQKRGRYDNGVVKMDDCVIGYEPANFRSILEIENNQLKVISDCVQVDNK